MIQITKKLILKQFSPEEFNQLKEITSGHEVMKQTGFKNILSDLE